MKPPAGDAEQTILERDEHFYALLYPVLKTLTTRWPKVFTLDKTKIRPWSLDMFEAVRHELPDFSRDGVRAALEVYSSTEDYLAAVTAGGPRYGLHGKMSGKVTPEEMADAVRELKRRRAKSRSAAKLTVEIKRQKVRIK